MREGKREEEEQEGEEREKERVGRLVGGDVRTYLLILRPMKMNLVQKVFEDLHSLAWCQI